ncbi:SDR family oxidoreductase [Candidatus Woesearchaeota archaeon]|nr:SDR family oxidoreductase [Candidatus Woesearchaeota archaeon]
MVEGKTVLITGASMGIGRQTAFLFAKEGAKVILTYHKDKKEAEDAAKKCKELGAKKVLVINLNVMDDASIKSCISEAAEKFKQIDIFINNAGVIAWKPLLEQSYDEIESQIRVNYEGLVKMTKEALPYVKDMIINIASGAGKTGYPSLSTYCGTKFAVRGFTQSMAGEIRDMKWACVNPGMTATRMTNFSGDPPEKVAKIILDTASGKIKPDSKLDVDVWGY